MNSGFSGFCTGQRGGVNTSVIPSPTDEEILAQRPLDPDGQMGFALLERLRRGESIKSIHDSYAALRASGDPVPSVWQLMKLSEHLEEQAATPTRMADGIVTNGRGGFATGRVGGSLGSFDAEPPQQSVGTGHVQFEDLNVGPGGVGTKDPFHDAPLGS
jgi:hypothetical protein